MEASQPKKLLPVNDISKDKSFSSFVANLEDAIKNKDANFIKSIASSDIIFTFGYEPGYEKDPIGTFLRYYKIGKNYKKSTFWNELKNVIDLGCVMKSRNKFECPYIYSNWPNIVGYDFVVALSNKTEIKEKTNRKSKTIKNVSFEILKVLPPGLQDDWYKVQISESNKTVGYVHKNDVRSSVGYRAYFQKEDNKWKLTTFIGGD